MEEFARKWLCVRCRLYVKDLRIIAMDGEPDPR